MFGYKCKNDHVTQDETTDSPEIVCPKCREEARWQALNPEIPIHKKEAERNRKWLEEFVPYPDMEPVTNIIKRCCDCGKPIAKIHKLSQLKRCLDCKDKRITESRGKAYRKRVKAILDVV